MAVKDGGSGVLVRNAWILVGGFIAFFFLNVLNASYSKILALRAPSLSLTIFQVGLEPARAFKNDIGLYIDLTCGHMLRV